MKVAIHLMLLLLSLLLLPALHAGLYLNSLKLPECPAKFIKDLAFGKDGAIWVATEDNDIWQLPDYAKSKTWIQHTPFADTPITHNYNTVCVDDKGLVWVGSDRRGLAVSSIAILRFIPSSSISSNSRTKRTLTKLIGTWSKFKS